MTAPRSSLSSRMLKNGFPATLAGCGKPLWARQSFIGLYVGGNRSTPRRMLKKAVQQGRSKRSGEEVRTALRVGRSPLQWVLANGKAPPVFPTSETLLLNVEPLSAARTPLADFFSILLEFPSCRLGFQYPEPRVLELQHQPLSRLLK